MGCAAHEIGHAVAHLLNGMPIDSVAIFPDGDSGWIGVTHLGATRIPDSAVAGHQVALLAGEAAAYRYLTLRTDLAFERCRAIAEASGADGVPVSDLQGFWSLDAQAQTKPGVGLNLQEARRRASELVTRHGAAIDALTRWLADDLELTGDDLAAQLDLSMPVVAVVVAVFGSGG